MGKLIIDAAELHKLKFGDIQMWGFSEGSIILTPYPTKQTFGNKHDIATCKKCQQAIKQATTELTALFAGDGKRIPFPACCEPHRALGRLPNFDRNDFKEVPKWTAEKLAFVKNHILNNIDSPAYYEEITDYLEYTFHSMGTNPKGCGEPLFFNYLYFHIKDFLQKYKDLPRKKANQLLEYVEGYGKEGKTNERPDFDELADVYNKWLQIFPFDLPVFSDLKKEFSNVLPFLGEQQRTNKYLGTIVFKQRSKAELFEVLENTTNTLLARFTTLSEAGNFGLKEWQQKELEAIVQRRRQQLLDTQKLTLTDFNSKILQWLEHEIQFAKAMKHFILDEQKSVQHTETKAPAKPATEKTQLAIQVINATKFKPALEYLINTGIDSKLLSDAIEGQKLENRLFWPQRQNQLADLFRRLKKGGAIGGADTDLAKWLSINFEFKDNKGNRKEFRFSTCYDAVNGKRTAAKKSRILDKEYPEQK